MTDRTTQSDDATTDDDRDDRDDGHLSDVPDGAGCTEIWEHIGDRREDDE